MQKKQNKKLGKFYFFKKKKMFFGRFSAFYGQRSVTAAWATPSPWSITYQYLIIINSFISIHSKLFFILAYFSAVRRYLINFITHDLFIFICGIGWKVKQMFIGTASNKMKESFLKTFFSFLFLSTTSLFNLMIVSQFQQRLSS